METSLQVLGYRAADSGMLNARSHRNFYAALHRKKYLKREPLDETIPIQKPQKMKSIIDLVIKKGMVDFRRMIENDWMVEKDFLHRITGIDLSFFDNYMTKERDFELVNVEELSSVICEKNRKRAESKNFLALGLILAMLKFISALFHSGHLPVILQDFKKAPKNKSRCHKTP